MEIYHNYLTYTQELPEYVRNALHDFKNVDLDQAFVKCCTGVEGRIRKSMDRASFDAYQ
jgi:hypothetical protein